ncbi:MAG: D-glycerate dehydrogenase, partial [Pseudomonadota bacterium]
MSGKLRVLVGRKLPGVVEARLARDYDAILNPEDRAYPSDELVAKLQDCDAIVASHTEHFSADVIDRLPSGFKAICNVSVGHDHVDKQAAKARGVVVTNTPDVLNDATAEIAMLCMLGAARRASEGERLIREHAWKDWSLSFMVGVQVTGKTLGILGMGRIGEVLAKRAKGFDMRVLYHNRRPSPTADAIGAEYVDSLDALLAQSDYFSLNCPATPETKGILNAERIAKLPKGAVVINTARGVLVDDDALIAALKSGHLFAAGLDV